MKRRPMPPARKELTRAARLAWATALSRRAQVQRLARDTRPSTTVQALVLARGGMACSCCGTSVIGRTFSVCRRNRGAGDSLANLLVFLGDGTRPDDPADHRARVESGRDPTDAARGFRVPAGQDPALVPVAVSAGPDGSRVTLWLDDAGRYLTEPPSGDSAAPGRG